MRRSVIATGLNTELNDEVSVTQAVLRHNIGALQAEMDQFAEAEDTLQAAARLSHAVGYDAGAASAVFTLGWVYERQQNSAQAIASYLNALHLFEWIDDPSRQTRAFNNISLIGNGL